MTEPVSSSLLYSVYTPTRWVRLVFVCFAFFFTNSSVKNKVHG